MRIIKKNIDSSGVGSVTLFPEEPEDMWHTYNLIARGDILRAPALRRVTTTSATGSTSSTRVHTTFSLAVQNLDFDPQAAELHIAGTVCAENPYTKIGAHHTLDLELARNFTLEKKAGEEDDTKGGGGWDSVALETLREATDPARRATAMACVMGEGVANICLVTEFRTVLKQRVEVAVPRKRGGGKPGGDHDKGLDKFFQITMETLLRHVETSNASTSSSSSQNPSGTPPPILLASPGFTATQFHGYLTSYARRTTHKPLLALLPSILIVHSSSSHIHSLNEILTSPAVIQKLSNTRFARETRAMDDLYAHLRRETGKAVYGPSEVERAVFEKEAVGRGGGVLLVCNALFRSQEVGVRRRWVRVVERVREMRGEVRVLSSAHESGRRLEALGGVAAVTTFPVEESEGEEEQEDEGGGEEALKGQKEDEERG
ncbi:MAG: Translation factor pelota [Caeruleum heppii]|nr:MAG: Translation factor pelota [Caeruleum heppii]